MKNTKIYKKEKTSFKGKAARDPKKSQGRPSGKQQQRKKGDSKFKIDLFGLHAVREAWLNPKRHIHALLITNSVLDQFASFLTTSNHIKSTQNQFPAILADFIQIHIFVSSQGINYQRFNSQGIDYRGIISLKMYVLFL